MRSIVNLTSDPVKVRTDWGEIEFAPSGTTPRISFIEEDAESLKIGNMPEGFDVPCITQALAGIEGLPEESPGTVYIVPKGIFEALPGRHDLITPDTGKTCIKDKRGRILAVTRFIRR